MNHVVNKGQRRPWRWRWFSSQSHGIVLDKEEEPPLDPTKICRDDERSPAVDAFAAALRECRERGSLGEGKRIHAQIVSSGLERHRFLANLVMEMYGKCGRAAESLEVFHKMEDRNVFSWNIAIAAFAHNGQMREALTLFRQMLLDGEHPNCVTFMAAVNADPAKIHALVVAAGLDRSTSIATALLNAYGKLGMLDHATLVFQGIEFKDAITWNALVSACAHNHRGSQALELFRSMLLEGIKPNHITFLSIVAASSSIMDDRSSTAREDLIHSLVVEAGYDDHLSIANCLVDCYSKRGSLDTARALFDSMKRKDVVSWNTMISAYSRSQDGDQEALDLFQRMLDDPSGPEPDRLTFLSVVDACNSLEQGRTIHALAMEKKIASEDVVLQTALLNMYARCHSLEDARKVFAGMCRKDAICWNSLLAAYAQSGSGKEALQIFREMDLEGCKSSRVSLMLALEACSNDGGDAIKQGRALHERIVASGYGGDVVACSALVTMYGKCKCVDRAKVVFQSMPERNVVTWTALIGALVDNDRDKEAMELFRTMDHSGVKPNDVTFVSTIDACANSMDLASGIVFHRRAAEVGMDSNVIVANSLIKMYGKCKRLEEAMSVFNRILGIRDLVSWNALISAFAQNGDGRRALETYWAMIREGVRPDRITFISVLDACATLGSIAEGREIHRQASEGGFESVDAVLGTLVNMYGRCGNAMEAELAFGKLQQRDAIAWNAVAAAITQTGDQRRALGILRGMDNEGVKPDNVTFITLLDTCADCNALVEGKIFHARAMELGFGFDIILGNALLNMYGKCGSLREANRVFAAMPVRNSVSWNTLIVAYAQNGHVKLAIGLFRDMDLEGIVPNQVSFLSIFFACSHAGMLEEGCKYFQYMVADHGLVPTPEHYGCFVDLLGRTGRLADAEELVTGMANDARSLDWLILLGSSTLQENVEQAKRAVQHAVKLGSKQYWNC
ncbi:pentatricopeptide repeat-containing protein At3g09040, mitochondrial [Selaginella moellendorffii]|uniref:pentatricopeptide repeat-containing protein At3g09040, mitochondrial n=1 Tax=Selaginella moellendorffii TaxID=88036 RepID=UPI000D1CDE8B|nr:pentatricopeptide repeat-containing protein At3g09040, mitochondrial [Selaginella moellendorffii]|eukprot:XP_024519385.1 pentatricopeptide repeat-containing protein At3g09040, mitochondrial [Selaginella moellendorffii]